MSLGNPSEHISKLNALREQEPKGHASIQNALEMGRAALLCVDLFSFLLLFTVSTSPIPEVFFILFKYSTSASSLSFIP